MIKWWVCVGGGGGKGMKIQYIYLKYSIFVILKARIKNASPFLKVIVKYNRVERLKIIKEEHEKAALKSLLNKASPKAVLWNFSLRENYKREMLDIVKDVFLT